MITQFESPLQPEECLRRLASASDQYETVESRPITGRRVGQSRFYAGCKQGFWRHQRNDFRPFIYVDVEPRDSGSHIGIRFGASLFARIFTVSWLGFLAVTSVCVFTAALLSGRDAISAFREVSTLLVLALAGWLAIPVGLFLGRAHRPVLTAFVKQQTEATDPAASSPSLEVARSPDGP